MFIKYDYFENCEGKFEDLLTLNNSYILISAFFNKDKTILYSGILYDIYYFSQLEINNKDSLEKN
ncbi:hypothetical protein FLAVO9AF_390001 [Flavobacterium sp. 9AF]|nr:hypothetical protein FLAVO9AF_390001 [Flavobacterium sp. 9AF]